MTHRTVILVGIPPVMGIDDGRHHFNDEFLYWINQVQETLIKEFIAQIEKLNPPVTEDFRRLHGRIFFFLNNLGIELVAIGALAGDTNRHIITGRDMLGDGSSHAQNFIVHVCGDHQNFHQRGLTPCNTRSRINLTIRSHPRPSTSCLPRTLSCLLRSVSVASASTAFGNCP